MRPQIAILAAGRGTRLGRPHPKPLTPLADGRTIMAHQLGKIGSVFPSGQIYIVVGFKLEMILEAHPQHLFVYNDDYDETNTSQSLLRVLQTSADGGVLWMNGDVVFDRAILDRARELMQSEQSFVAVNTSRVAEEEVKYTLDADGWIAQLSKSAPPECGEAVGINYVAAADKQALIARLREVDAQDYFERGIELAIEHDALRFAPLDISALSAVEVDTPDDLVVANRSLRARQDQSQRG